MAKAEDITRTVTEIRLTLSVREAQVLRAILGSVGGDGCEDGPRRCSEDTQTALWGCLTALKVAVPSLMGRRDSYMALPGTWKEFHAPPEA